MPSHKRLTEMRCVDAQAYIEEEKSLHRLNAAQDLVHASRDIPDFEYSGPLAIGETWAFTLSQTRDSDILAQDDFEEVRLDMLDRFVEDIEIVRCTHWAVGWVEYLAVRMLNEDSTVTTAGAAILEWKIQLATRVLPT